MSEKKLNWGVLGVSRIGNKLIPAIQKAPSSQVLAIASRTREKSQETAEKYGIALAETSYEAILENPDIDVIYIPLPNGMHAEWVKKAAEKKKHVLCEKPFGMTHEEVVSATRACAENKVKFMEGFMWPHHPRTPKLKKLIESGRLGKVLHVSTAFNFLLSDQHSNVRRNPDLGGGALYDVGCYCVYGIRWALGEEPASVFASAELKTGIDTEMNAVLEFASGKTAQFHASFNHSYRSFLEVVGTEAVLRVPQMWNPFSNPNAEIWEKGEFKETISFETADQISCMVENFNRYILKEEFPPIDLHSPEKNLRVIDALYESAWTGEKVPCSPF